MGYGKRAECLNGRVGAWAVFVFFFQAEDGIRDWSVTGVQTCALPIWEDATRTDSPDDDTFRPPPSLDFEAKTGSFSEAPPTERGAAYEDDVTGRLGGLEIGRASCRGRGEVGGGGVRVKKRGGERG